MSSGDRQRSSAHDFHRHERRDGYVRLRSAGARRVTALGYSDYIYEDGMDWLVRETWHAITNTITGTFELARYWYANGKPSRVEIANVTSDLQNDLCASGVLC